MASFNAIIGFNSRYFAVAIFMLFIEILIAVFLNDDIIRPYVGDFLVVILLYSFFRSFLDLPANRIAIFVLIFSYVIEFSQYLHLIKRLGLENSKLAKSIMGSSFGWIDMLAYTMGIILVCIVENVFAKMRTKQITIDNN
jgi:hypothetical protein